VVGWHQGHMVRHTHSQQERQQERQRGGGWWEGGGGQVEAWVHDGHMGQRNPWVGVGP
jgi:hypothetical protein